MALKHILSLNIVDGCNPNNYTIIDTSNYAPISINCPTLGITIPGVSGPKYWSQGTLPNPTSDLEDVYNILPTYPTPYTGNPPVLTNPYSGVPKFVLTVDNIFLCVQGTGETLNPLPDGLWVIDYCVKPCDKSKVTYYYLRTTMALHRYAGLLCKLRLSDCLPSQETIQMIDQLHTIKMYLDAAKAKVEVCHAPKEGQAMYEYAIKLMNNWEKACCSNC